MASAFRRDVLRIYGKGLLAVLIVSATAWVILLNALVSVGPSSLKRLALPSEASAIGLLVAGGAGRGVEFRDDTLFVWRRWPAITFRQATEMLLFKPGRPAADTSWSRLTSECGQRDDSCRIRIDTVDAYTVICRETSGRNTNVVDGDVMGLCAILNAPLLAVYSCKGRRCETLHRIAVLGLGSFDTTRAQLVTPD